VTLSLHRLLHARLLVQGLLQFRVLQALLGQRVLQFGQRGMLTGELHVPRDEGRLQGGQHCLLSLHLHAEGGHLLTQGRHLGQELGETRRSLLHDPPLHGATTGPGRAGSPV
jgi:hypothetical protein